MSRPARTTICWSRRSPPTRARSACSATPTSRRMPTRCGRCRSPAIAPTEETIADLTYPGARKLYIYVKGEHMRRQAQDARLRRGIRQGLGQGRPARAARPGAVRRAPMPRPRLRAGGRAQAARPGDAEVSEGGGRMSLGHCASSRSLLVAAAAGWLGYSRARRLARRRPAALAARLSRRLCCLWAALPALLLLAAWAPMQSRLVDQAVLASPGGPGACPPSRCSASRSCPKRARSPSGQTRAGLQSRNRSSLAPRYPRCRDPLTR